MNDNKNFIGRNDLMGFSSLTLQVQKNNWYQREIDRLKDELNGRDIKIKWMQTKLKSEMEAHQVDSPCL